MLAAHIDTVVREKASPGIASVIQQMAMQRKRRADRVEEAAKLWCVRTAVKESHGKKVVGKYATHWGLVPI